MTITLTAWLALTLCLGVVSMFAVWSRRDTGWRSATTIAFMASAVASFYVIQLPLGYPTTASLPAGEYTVLGARIDVPTDTDAGAIYVLLDGPIPRYHRLPYSTGKANELQKAMDEGEGVGMDVGEGGDLVFHPPPVAPDEVKVPEKMMEVG